MQNSVMLLCLFFLVGCNDNGLSNSEYYSNGKLKSITVILNKDSNDYIQISFYENGAFKDSTPYKHGLYNGIKHSHAENDSIDEFTTYKNGIELGKHWGRYKNKKLAFEETKKNGKYIGEWRHFFFNGQISSYTMFDDIGTLKYFRIYDKNGKLLDERGDGFIEKIFNDTALNSGQEFRIKYILAKPPDCDVNLIVGVIKGGKTLSLNSGPPDRNVVYFAHTFKEPGEYIVKAVVEITDLKTTEIQRNALITNVKVNAPKK